MTEFLRRAAGAVLTGALALAALTGAVAGPAPRGVHIAFGADPRTSATVTWFTDGSADPGTVVGYGAAADALTATATGSTSMAPGSGYPAGGVRVHEVALTGLTPGAEVFYRVGAPDAWSPVRSFRTAPAGDEAFRFVAYGDQDVNARAATVTERILETDPDLVLIAGDLSYAQPGTPTFPEWPKWDSWFDMIEPLASTRAFMPAVGNHECESVGCTSSYRSRFALPGAELFYGFDYANAHFAVFLSDRATWTQERTIADALAFLRADLEAAAARKTAGEIDWIFVVQHHPLYGSQRGDIVADELLERKRNPALIALEEPLLHAYDVDVLITGHNHNYERSYPMVFGVPTSSERSAYESPDGFVQVITGGGGRGTAPQDAPTAVASWSAAGARRLHFTEFVIDGNTLTFRAVGTDDEGPALIDSFTITRA